MRLKWIHLNKIKLYACLVIIFIAAFMPLKVFAVDVDYGFYSANDILFYDPNAACSATPADDGGPLIGNGNAEKAWCYFVNNGISKNGAAGIIGNMTRESHVTPNLWQYGSVCNDKKSNYCGYGLVQWSWQTYKWDGDDTLWKFAGETFPDTGGKVGKLKTQLDYLMHTLEHGHSSLLSKLKKSDISVEDQACNFYIGYEMPGGSCGDNNNTIGTRNALRVYSQYHDSSCGTNSTLSTTSTETTTTVTSSGSSSTTNDSQTVVIIDPGHANTTPAKPDIDPAGLKDVNYPSTTPEMWDAFDVAKIVRTKLSAAGYKALLTKSSINSVPTSYERAMFSNDNDGDIALSIHTDSGTWSGFGKGGQIYAQKTTGYREKPDGTKVKFTNTSVAEKSQAYARKFLAARSKNEHNLTITDANFDRRGSEIAKGNLPIVQLLSNVPWVYNEAGARPGDHGDSGAGLTATQKQKYADELVEGVKNSIGPNQHQGTSSGETNSQCGGMYDGAVQGDIIQTAKNFAWPTHKNPNLTPKPSYVEAVKKYDDSWIYNMYKNGNDILTACNVYVATVMRASVDSNYSLENTTGQIAYIRAHPDLYKEVSPDNKQPGDILITTEHTYLYAGNQGYSGYNALSASYHSRVPMASTYYPGSMVVRYIGNGQ